MFDEITYPFPNFHGASKHRDNRQLIKLHNTLADLYIDRLISMILFYTCKKWLKSTIFTKENSFENVICKLAAILSGSQCVKQNASAIMSNVGAVIWVLGEMTSGILYSNGSPAHAWDGIYVASHRSAISSRLYGRIKWVTCCDHQMPFSSMESNISYLYMRNIVREWLTQNNLF